MQIVKDIWSVPHFSSSLLTPTLVINIIGFACYPHLRHLQHSPLFIPSESEESRMLLSSLPGPWPLERKKGNMLYSHLLYVIFTV